MSKAFVVHVTRRAMNDLQAIYEWIAKDSVAGANAWLNAVQGEIKGLSHFPRRCGQAREAVAVGLDLRQLTVGRYRVLFVMDGAAVHVLHVRHSARDTADREDLL